MDTVWRDLRHYQNKSLGVATNGTDVDYVDHVDYKWNNMQSAGAGGLDPVGETVVILFLAPFIVAIIALVVQGIQAVF